MLKCLIYASKQINCDAAALAQIDALSKANNARDGLTGVLVHDDRMFMQMIEGDHDAVGRCFLRIHQNPLHSDVDIIALADREVRMFANWSMGLVEMPTRGPNLSTVIRKLKKTDTPEERFFRAQELFLELAGDLR